MAEHLGNGKFGFDSGGSRNKSEIPKVQSQQSTPFKESPPPMQKVVHLFWLPAKTTASYLIGTELVIRDQTTKPGFTERTTKKLADFSGAVRIRLSSNRK